MEKIKARKQSKEELLAKREQAIELYNQGTPVMKIGEACGLSWPAVNTAIKLYKAGGESNLEPQRRGRKQGTGRVLNAEQEDELRNILYKKDPRQAVFNKPSRDLSRYLSNLDADMKLIHEQYGVKLSVRDFSRYHHRWSYPMMKQNRHPRHARFKQNSRDLSRYLGSLNPVLDLLLEQYRVKLSVGRLAEYLQRWGFSLKQKQRPGKRPRHARFKRSFRDLNRFLKNLEKVAELIRAQYRARLSEQGLAEHLFGFKPPSRDNLSHFLWNRDTVMKLIDEQYGVKLSVRGVAKYLQRWGFPLMKKNQRPRKRCTRAIQAWLEAHYESLDKRYKAGIAEIYWVSRKKIVVANDKQNLSMISVIDNHGKEHWLIVNGNFTQKKQKSLLNALVKSSTLKIILIRSNSDHFTDEPVISWIYKNNKKIESYPPLLPNEAIKKKAAEKRAEVTLAEIRNEKKEKS